MPLPQLRRVRWAVRATLLLGVAASVVANILHALENPISQAIAAWPPLALLLTVELISRVPVHRRSLAFTRLVATATIAGIAAWVSYWHMAGVAARYGETGASPYLLPLSVDGLIVVASICLVELGGRIAALQADRDRPLAALSGGDATPAASPTSGPLTSPVTMPAPDTAPAARPTPTAASVAVRSATEAAPVAARSAAGDADDPTDGTSPSAGTAAVAVAFSHAAPARPAPGGQQTARADTKPRHSTADAFAEVAAALPRATDAGFTPTVTRGSGRPGTSSGPNAKGTAKGPATRTKKDSAASTRPGARQRRSPQENAAIAARLRAERPELTDAELAAELGISVERWRRIQRETAKDLETAKDDARRLGLAA
ncbi:DUF2637 domain-containing protein [Krasilnikovia sp. M28-CT-15]|uniref:DUF2637 domain-containing protein n=1 Tax=Krasilnikovia sp. M28-CT-15 TaxID=3373540 RepID=UPI003876F99B